VFKKKTLRPPPTLQGTYIYPFGKGKSSTQKVPAGRGYVFPSRRVSNLRVVAVAYG